MSYDDGSEHDRRLVELFNRYGIRGSFNLNSGKLGKPHYIAPHEVRPLYRGHEVACHTVNHPNLVDLPEAAIRSEILADKQALERLIGAPVRGLAYPFGTHDERILAMLPELGIAYARTAADTDCFDLPTTPLAWAPSCHHNRALALGERFLAEAGTDLAVLFIWGHSYEFDGFMSADASKDWHYLERLCRLLGGRDAIYYTTAIELADYLAALGALQQSAAAVHNPTATPVWLHWQGKDIELKPGGLAE